MISNNFGTKGRSKTWFLRSSAAGSGEDEFLAVGNPEFGEDPRQVGLHRGGRHEQLLADGRVRQTFGDEVGNLAFRRREGIPPRGGRDLRGLEPAGVVGGLAEGERTTFIDRGAVGRRAARVERWAPDSKSLATVSWPSSGASGRQPSRRATSARARSDEDTDTTTAPDSNVACSGPQTPAATSVYRSWCHERKGHRVQKRDEEPVRWLARADPATSHPPTDRPPPADPSAGELSGPGRPTR
jgi:hypothetical protein